MFSFTLLLLCNGQLTSKEILVSSFMTNIKRSVARTLVEHENYAFLKGSIRYEHSDKIRPIFRGSAKSLLLLSKNKTFLDRLENTRLLFFWERSGKWEKILYGNVYNFSCPDWNNFISSLSSLCQFISVNFLGITRAEYTDCTTAEGLDPPPPNEYPSLPLLLRSSLARRGSTW